MIDNKPASEFPVSVRDIVISDPHVLAVPQEGPAISTGIFSPKSMAPLPSTPLRVPT